MIKGDLIKVTIPNVRGEFNFVYDGCNFIPFEYTVPEQFRVLENGVPVDYWLKDDLIKVYFNPKPYRDQLFANIKEGDHDNFDYESYFFINKDKYIVKFINELDEVKDSIRNDDLVQLQLSHQDKDIVWLL